MNSVVTLFARPSFVTLPPEVQEETIVKYGSFYRENTRAIAKGLTEDEEREVLAPYIGVSPDDVMNYPQAVRNFWAELSKPIPSDGATLNIAHQIIKRSKTVTVYEGNKEVEKTVEYKIRVPEVVEDFCVYALAMTDSRVATSDADLDDREGFKFYMVNPKQVQEMKTKKLQAKKKASRIFSLLTRDEATQEDLLKMEALIEVFKPELIEVNEYPTTTGDKETDLLLKQAAISYLTENLQERVVEEFEDKRLVQVAKIHALVDKGVVTKEGNVFFNQDNEQIAGDIDEMIRYMNSSKNSGEVAKMNIKLNQKEKKPAEVKN